MGLSDSAFTALADATLNRLAGMLEVADEEGLLEVELANSMLTVDLPNGRQFIVHKHGPSKQIWLSSPLSGGLHFDYDEEEKDWRVIDGTRLDTLLKAEVETLLAED